MISQQQQPSGLVHETNYPVHHETGTSNLPSFTQRRTRNEKRREKRFKGLPASPGIMIAQATLFISETPKIHSGSVALHHIPSEHERFALAVEECSRELQRIVSIAQSEAPVAAPILEAQLLIMNDPAMGEMIHRRIDEQCSAEFAVQQVYDEQHRILDHAQNAYLRERAVDLDNVKNRLIDFLCQRHTTIQAITQGEIIVASALTPSDLMLFKQSGMAGFVTEVSGITSHTAILARSLHIPAVIGVPHITTRINAETPVIIDGYAGIVIIHPKPETIHKYERRKADFEKREKKLGKLVKMTAQTTDGRKIHLLANADTSEEIEESLACGAEGIGLVRTELPLMSLQRFPDENEQTAWYTELAERAYPLPVTIRAFDVGSDKSLGFLPPEPNPALGLRGLRFLLKHQDIFFTQLRAVLRSSLHRNVRLMLPMVSSVQEIHKTQALIEKVKKSLREDEQLFDESMPVGIMIETPAAALIAKELGAMTDFFSIGTNDLVQYTLAADRLNTNIVNLYDAFHPSVLRLLKMTIEAARFNNISVAVCGEFAGHSAATELLIGLGIEELSVVPSILLELKKRVRKSSYSDAVTLSNEVLHLHTGVEIRRYIASTIRKKRTPAKKS